MTWFIEDNRTWTQKLFGNILKTGPVPKHVAIIMDGNRRFARLKNIKKIEGHISGFEKLVETLNWCFTIGIKEVSVYAFSIENFKRSPDEVNALFDLAREKFQRLLEEKDKLDQMGVCVRIFGDQSLLPNDLQKIIAKIMHITKHNKNLFMNVCFAYTSRDEMTMSIRDICEGIRNDKIDISDINENLIEKCLYTGNSAPVDLLVRTSGEVRLSDFLLWQSNLSALSFFDKMWPEFSIWNFYMGVFSYQLNYSYTRNLKLQAEKHRRNELEVACKMTVIENRKELVDKIKNREVGNSHDEDLQALAKHVAVEAVENCITQHKERTSRFLSGLYEKREKSIDLLAVS